MRTVRLIGGPADGHTVDTDGFQVEIPNPDKSLWGDWEYLAYSIEYQGEEVVGRFSDA